VGKNRRRFYVWFFVFSKVLAARTELKFRGLKPSSFQPAIAIFSIMASGRGVKRRRISTSNDEGSLPAAGNSPSLHDFYKRASQWNLEQDYERLPRKAGKKDKEKTRLPIKTADGTLQEVEKPEIVDDETDDFQNTNTDLDEVEKPVAPEESHDIPKVPLKIQIIQTKEELARIAALINEDPEEHVASLKKLADMVDKGPHPAIKKLALATQAAVFRDIIPGYKIRPLSDNEIGSKLSKEVRQLRNYEQSLLSAYRHYIQQLSSLTKSSSQGRDQSNEGMRTAAINCTCSLLLAVPHFNFRGELLKILVHRLSKKRPDGDFAKCRKTLEDIFEKDDDGVVSLEAVSLLSKMMKAREYRIHDSVLDTFLHLRLLTELSTKGSKDKIEPGSSEPIKGKKAKVNREFWTKKRRKLEKDRKTVEKDMKEADALVGHEERDKNQAETLKLVFGAYFRILKLRSESLMGAVLEGLAKYAHLINQDFFGDLLEALKDLISQLGAIQSVDDRSDTEESITIRNSAREMLLCTITAFALLEGQETSKAAALLHLDLSFFITHLYCALYPLSMNPDIEYNPTNSLRLPDPNSADPENHTESPQDVGLTHKVNFQTPTVLLLRCLQSTLVSRNHGVPPPTRLASFTKRMMTVALQLPEKSSLAMLSLLALVAKQHGRKIAPLWHTEERKGDGVFIPFATNVEESNAFAGTIWEGEILRLHYCPQVRDAAANVEKLITTAK
jgi:nucleolar complex protein 3